MAVLLTVVGPGACFYARAVDAAEPHQDLTFSIPPGGALVLPVTIEGQVGKFLLDTGSTHHVLDKLYEPILGDRKSIRRAGTTSAEIPVKFFAPPRMYLRDAALARNSPVASFELKPLSQALGFPVHGILGSSLLQEYIVILDFDAGVARLADPAIPILEVGEYAASLSIDASGRPFVPNVTMGGVKSSFLLDTGQIGASVALSTLHFQRLVDEGLISSVRPIESRDGAGDAVHRGGILKMIQLGPFVHHRVSVVESNRDALGLSYLSRFRVTLDVPNRRMYLARSRHYDRREGEGSSGLGLLWIDGDIEVIKVLEQSPAERAGIREGDILVQLNGEQTRGSRLLQIRQTLQGDVGTKIEMVLSRDCKRRSISLTLERYGDWDQVAAQATDCGPIGRTDCREFGND